MKAGQFTQVRQLIDNRLLGKDLSGIDDVIVTVIEKYLDQAGETELSALIKALKAVKIENPCPLWQQQLSKWTAPTSVPEPNSPK